jgi:hypothetical protein
MVEAVLHLHAKRPVNDLAASLPDLGNVGAVLAAETNAADG